MHKMSSYNDYILWLIICLIIDKISAVFYNQPTFCPLTKWNPNGLAFAKANTVGNQPYGIFVDTNNTVYVTNRDALVVQVWSYGSVIPTRTLSGNLTYPRSLFVTSNGDIYADNGDQGRVNKWSLNSTNSEIVINFSGICFGLFVDINNNLYCSVGYVHQVEKISLNNSLKTRKVIAGNGTKGPTSYLLDEPRGIFVDTNLDLYVADSDNSRIQLFRSGERNATTVAGHGVSGAFTLVTPHGITLDGDGYLFIVDSGNNRILTSGPGSFRCLVGCNGKGSSSNKLSFPQTMAFDSYGNIFVTDRDNNRIQKFTLTANPCKYTSTNSSITTIKTELKTEPEIETTIETTTIQQTIESTIIQMTEQVTEQTAEPTTIQMIEQTTIQMMEQTTVEPTETCFIPPTCSDTTRIGLTCNISNTPCDMLKPCQNNGICNNTNINQYGYQCSCPLDFSGINCEVSHRPCEPNPCWNDGECNVFNTTFNCTCVSGWQDSNCQTKIDYCQNITCLNNGVCRPSFRNFTCDCLGESYYGYYCEITATKTIIYQVVSKSFAYIAIIAMVSVATFVIVMDILKYYFGIDPTRKYLILVRRIKRAEKDEFGITKPSINVIPPSPKSPSAESSVTIEEAYI